MLFRSGASHAECARTHTRRAPRHGDACARGPQQRTSTRVASSGQPSKDYSAWKPPRRGQRGEASRGARARPLLARPFSSSCAGHRCSSRPQEDRTVPRHAQAWGSAAGATASTDAGGVASWSESRSIPLENHGLLRFRHRSVRWIGLWGVLQSTPAAPLPLSLLLQIGRAHV